MRKSILFLVILFLVFLALNLVFYLKIPSRCKTYHKQYAKTLVEKCGASLEEVSMHFESEANFILFSDDLSAIFEDPVTRIRGSRKLESFYSEYADLIKDITVYDNQLNVYSLFRDNTNLFISDYYLSQNQKPLVARDRLVQENGKSIYYLPVFKGKDEVVGNIAMNIKQKEYFNEILDLYRNGPYAKLLMLDKQGNLFLPPREMDMDSLTLPRELRAELEQEEIGAQYQEILLQDEPAKMVVAYYPVRFVKEDYYILYFQDISQTLDPYFTHFLLISGFSFILLIILVWILIRFKP